MLELDDVCVDLPPLMDISILFILKTKTIQIIADHL